MSCSGPFTPGKSGAAPHRNLARISCTESGKGRVDRYVDSRQRVEETSVSRTPIAARSLARRMQSSANMATRRTERRHPILSTEVLGIDGDQHSHLRVFCDVRSRSIPLDVCRACPSCTSISAGENGGPALVRCAPDLEDVEPVALSPSGRAVHRGVVAVDEDVLVRDVVALFAKRKVRIVVVTNAAGRAKGVVHESQLLREIHDYTYAGDMTRLGWTSATLEPASAIMFPAAKVFEGEPLRFAVESMSNGHQRQLLVVDEEGLPVGVLVDVDALHALYGRHRDQDE